VTWVKWKLVSVHLEIVLISAQVRARFAPNALRAWKSFRAHPMVLLGDVGQVQARFDPFGDSVNLSAR
jgi:hypothetical protein